MIGTIRVNVIVASIAFLFTFMLSIGNNLFLATCLNSFYSFLILFILTFGFRWILGTAGGLNSNDSEQSKEEKSASDSQVGSQLDMATPNEDEVTRQMLKANLSNPGSTAGTIDNLFSPLNPPKLATKNNLEPEQLAGALRRLSED